MTDNTQLPHQNIRRALLEMTGGEWSWEGTIGDYKFDRPTLYSDRNAMINGWPVHGLNLLGRLEPDSNGKANLDGICTLRNETKALLDERDALAIENARLQQEVESLRASLMRR